MSHTTRAHVHDTTGGEHGHDDAAHDHGHHHGHDHHHDHAQGRAARWAHALSELFGGHSHDAADRIDDAVEATSAGRQALLVSLVALLVTAAAQGVVVVVSGSVALLGDTLHNLVDAGTALPLLVAFGLAARARTDRYTHGFGRAEDLAGLVIVVMIALSGVLVAWESIGRLLDPRPVTHLPAVAAASVLGFLGNEWVARYRIRVGHQIGSAALVADGLHARTDGFTSLAVLVGAGGVAVGWSWADPLVGLLITVAILGVLRSAARSVGHRLLDAVEPDLVRRARVSAEEVDEVLAVDDLRLRWVGHRLRADVAVTVARSSDLPAADAVAAHVEDHLRLDLAHLGEVAVRVRASTPA
ncbi:cation diffusion facilitator family transporter [Nostocoides sp. Soil756]|jgi:cation diffusion facilitator family transporter|uniref:cation diffusion facilitator family transporter n=1 Tax=Nostocoides sp. Soil756 TaxID=1736399 RepID=UPI0009E9A0F4|nr:cation diffusion facilitator family transporter [Tetrasphaera sp. Soil756]